jgi:hypothetical protein
MCLSRLAEQKAHAEGKTRGVAAIIATMPDMPVPERMNCAGWESLHKMLRDYMEMERKYLKQLERHETNAFYTYELYEEITWSPDPYEKYHWTGGRSLYTQDYRACYDSAVSDCAEFGDERFRISKIYFDHPDENCRIDVEYRLDGAVLSIDVSGDVPQRTEAEYELEVESFDGLWFDIPIPFEKGDLVCDCFYGRPFVLRGTVPWYRRERTHRNKRFNNDVGDISDMNAYGYSYDFDDRFLYDDYLTYYLDLEYYRGELRTGERLLEVYSRFVKGEKEMDEWTLMRFLRLNEFELLAKKERKSLSWFFDHQAFLKSKEDRNVEDI